MSEPEDTESGAEAPGPEASRPGAVRAAAGQGAPQGFLAEVWDAVSVRTLLLVVGVLFLQLGFVFSYVGAFHHPTPHRISVAVVAPAQNGAQLAGRLNAISGKPLHATAFADEAIARRKLANGDTSAVLVLNPSGTTDRLLVASGGGASKATAIESVFDKVEASQKRKVTVVDAVPVQSGDARGLTGFYLVIGWTVGGYLVASLLGVAKGARPANGRRALIRLLAIVPYAIVSGLGGAIIVGPVLGALTGHLIALWWLGALLVFAAAAVTMAFQVLFGVLGIGIAVLLFVVLGNPSAGGAYPAVLLAAVLAGDRGALPNGAGTDGRPPHRLFRVPTTSPGTYWSSPPMRWSAGRGPGRRDRRIAPHRAARRSLRGRLRLKPTPTP